MTTTTTTQRPAPVQRAGRPVTATMGAVLLLALGTLNSAGGTVFSAIAGGAWLFATPIFAVASVLWWVAGIGMLRGNARSHRIGTTLLVAVFAFGLLKIFVYHEGAAYVFQALTVVTAAVWLSPAARAWVAGRQPGWNDA